MNLPRLRISIGLGFGLVLATAIVLGCTTRSTPTVHTAPLAAASPRAGANTLPAALVPAVTQALAANHPELWRAHATRTHVLTFDNPAQHVSARFDQSGAQLKLDGAKSAQLGMQLLALRSGKLRYHVATGKPLAHGNRVEFARGHGLSEWYVNSPLGIEQGFTLNRPISTSPTLVLSLRVQGALKPVLKGNALEFRDAQGKPVLHYGNLFVYDAQHHALPAHMRLTGQELDLEIDTRGAHYPVTLDPTFSAMVTLSDPPAAADDSFGESVAFSADGQTALVGAYGTVVNGNNSAGAAYVFTATNGTWSTTPVATFHDPAATANDQFGFSVGLSADGRTALIGAPGTSANSNSNVGVAYVYATPNGTRWAEVTALNDPPAASNDSFGFAVALSGDGQTALIGAYGTTVNGNVNAGAAYVFVESSGIWPTTPTITFDEPNGAANDLFGLSVALSGDGQTALIGAPFTPFFNISSAGVAYFYGTKNGTWQSNLPEDSVITPHGADEGRFGNAVALSSDGRTALIGADGVTNFTGAAYVFFATSGSWLPVATFNDPPNTGGDTFGNSVALSADGQTALIGAVGTAENGNSGAGAAYEFNTSSGTWSTTPVAAFNDPLAATNDGFGTGVALSADGQYSLIGAWLTAVSSQPAGQAYVFVQVDLALALAGNPAIVDPGQNVDYMLTVTNTDTQITATNVTLTDTLPTGMAYASANAAGGSCNNSSGTVTCTLASLAPQATWQPSITLTATASGSMKNTATLTASQADPNPANNAASVTTTVTVPAPVASDGSVTTSTDTAVNGTLAATGTGPLSFAIVAQPGHGAVTITNAASGAFTYAPASGYTGSDSFTFIASNSGGTSSIATENVTVDSVAPAVPVATGGSLATTAGKAVNGTLTATGTGPLSFAIVAQPAHGTVSITDAATGAFTYTPASGFSGSDSFTFTASNGGGASNTATEGVTVNASAGGGGGGGGSGGGGSSSGGGGGFGLLGLLLLAPLVRFRKRKA